MGPSRLSENCRKCPFVNTCEYKRMEALAFLTEPSVMTNAAPILRETMTIRIDGINVIVYKDDIEKELYKSLHTGLGLQFGG